MSALFCETDRAQRLKMPLALIHIGFSDCVSLQSAGDDPCREEIVRQIDERFKRLLRCYDSVGHVADGEFVLILPGCSLFNARTLAERLRDGVFRSPFEACGQEVHLDPSFGVVSSGGRSPFVVLREARKALQRAQATEPASIHCLGAEDGLDPGGFFTPVTLDESLQS